jgi:signal transduction histidine kinase
LKFWNKIYLRWLALSALITVICVYAGVYITHNLAEREKLREPEKRQENSVELMKSLAESGKMGIDEAYFLVEKASRARHRFPSILIDEQRLIVDATTEQPRRLLRRGQWKEYRLSSTRSVIFSNRPFADWNDRRGPPPRGGPGGGGPGGPPPEVVIIGAVVVAVSIVVGLGLSIIFLTLYLRKKSRQAEEVLHKLKSGDLKARFLINPSEESNLLMLKFNEMADQIENLVQNLRHTEEARKKMLQELAHDLRTPVASLKNLQEMLMDKGHLMDEADKKHAQSLSVKEVYYFERLVEDLLFLSGVNDPKYSASFKTMNLAQLIEEEIELVEDGKIMIVLHGDREILVNGDEHLLKRMVKNALSNAKKFADLRIDVTLKNEGEGIRLSIKDDGKGMPQDTLEEFGERKFSRQFGQEDKNISIGLGSVIMKKVMDLHTGEMSVQNLNPGFEISFKFKLS